MNVGAKLVQEVAQKSDNKAGDGTTTSTLMTLKSQIRVFVLLLLALTQYL